MPKGIRSLSHTREFVPFFIIPAIVPLLFHKFAPFHDGRLRYELWIPSIKSFSETALTPVWIPNLSGGINAAVYNQYLDGSDYLCVLLTSLFHISPHGIFAIYVFLNSLLISLSLRGIFLMLNLETSWSLWFTAYLTSSYFAWVQPAWNLTLISKFILFSFFLLNFLLNRDVKSLHLLIISILINNFFGGTPYLMIIPTYLLLFCGVIYLLCNLQLFFPRKESYVTFVKQYWYFLLLELFYISYSINQFLMFKNDIQIVSPGRGTNGGNSFDSFLYYGGFSDWRKYSMLIGSIDLNQSIGKGLPDFHLYMGPFTIPILVVLIFLGIKFKIKKIFYSLFFLIWFMLVFLPLKHFWYFVYPLPGVSNVRHLAYLSVLLNVLVPFFFIVSLKYIEQFKKLNDWFIAIRHRRFLYLLFFAFTVYWAVIMFELIRNYVFEGRILGLFFAILLLLIIPAFSLKKKIFSMQERFLFHSLSTRVTSLFFSFAIIHVAVAFLVLVPTQRVSNFNYLNISASRIEDKIPVYREENSKFESQFDLTGSIYSTRALFENRDTCYPLGREDLISKSRTNFSFYDCGGLKAYLIDLYGKPVEGNIEFKILSYNHVIISYEVPMELLNNPVYLVYDDSFSNFGLWDAFNKEGKSLSILRSDNGGKKVLLDASTGEIHFKIRNFFLALTNFKSFFDIFIYFFFLNILTKNLRSSFNFA